MIMTTENQNDSREMVEIANNEIKNTGESSDKKREILKDEKVLLFIAFAAAVLLDRLFFNIFMDMNEADNIFYFTAIFELCFLVLFCVFNREKLYKRPLLLFIAVMIISLCVWNFIFDYMSGYGTLTFVAIPASLMLFMQITAENHTLKNISGMIKSWFAGWFIKPFSAIKMCIEVLSGILFPKDSKTNAVIKKIAVALLITVPLIAILLFLLSGADKVFGYYVNKVFTSFDITDFILHSIIIVIAFLFFYSFFWNSRYGKSANAADTVKKEYKADNLILYIILSSVLVLYTLFCSVQFAYLFASAGLPEGISYSEYAREGFAQIVVISGINLIIFGLVLKFGKINKLGEKDIILKIMLYALIAMTGIMLASGFSRLGLYIDTFGMTFLRLLSAWFIIYLSLALILCAARLIKEKLPLIACCAVLLLFSYNILGYINPDSFIVKYNLSVNGDVNELSEKNHYYIFYGLSDDALNVLIDRGLDKNKYADVLEHRYNESANKRSFSSIKLKSVLKDN